MLGGIPPAHIPNGRDGDARRTAKAAIADTGAMPTLRSRLPQAPSTVPTPAVAVAATGDPRDPQKFAVQVRPSGIDGLGAFAAEHIPARRKIGEIRGQAIGHREAQARARDAARSSGRIFMIALSERRTLDASASADPLRHANHSCEPNMVLKVEQGRVAFYALRDIAPGEELTARYGATHHRGRLACRCGAARCQGWL